MLLLIGNEKEFLGLEECLIKLGRSSIKLKAAIPFEEKLDSAIKAGYWPIDLFVEGYVIFQDDEHTVPPPISLVTILPEEESYRARPVSDILQALAEQGWEKAETGWRLAGKQKYLESLKWLPPLRWTALSRPHPWYWLWTTIRDATSDHLIRNTRRVLELAYQKLDYILKPEENWPGGFRPLRPSVELNKYEVGLIYFINHTMKKLEESLKDHERFEQELPDLQKAVDLLEPLEKEIIIRYFITEKDTDEIITALGITSPKRPRKKFTAMRQKAISRLRELLP